MIRAAAMKKRTKNCLKNCKGGNIFAGRMSDYQSSLNYRGRMPWHRLPAADWLNPLVCRITVEGTICITMYDIICKPADWSKQCDVKTSSGLGWVSITYFSQYFGLQISHCDVYDINPYTKLCIKYDSMAQILFWPKTCNCLIYFSNLISADQHHIFPSIVWFIDWMSKWISFVRRSRALHHFIATDVHQRHGKSTVAMENFWVILCIL